VLDVVSTGNTTALLERTDGTYVLALKGNGTTSNGALGMATDDMVFLTNGAENLRIKSTGVILATNLAGVGSRAVIADASGNLSAPVSDLTVKENIAPLDYGLKEIMALNPVSFTFKEGWQNYGEGKQIGAIAQEVERIIPEAVFTTPSTGKMGINYEKLIPVLIKAIQEQQVEIDKLKNNQK